jgi:hypothetical protein
MIKDKSFAMFISTSRRELYLEHTIKSWSNNLIVKPTKVFIFDDSQSEEYFKMLNNKYGKEYKIVKVPKNFSGQDSINHFIFRYLKNTEFKYFLQVEEDWVLNRPLNILDTIDVLEKNVYLTQIRIPRSPWFDENWYRDILCGSNINHYANENNTIVEKIENWYKCRSLDFFWSNNPNIFSKKILQYEYPNSQGNFINSEQRFGHLLFDTNLNYYFGFWANNVYENYVSHIGVKDKKVLENTNIEKLNFPYENN